MHHSPALLTLLTVSATLSLAGQARGEIVIPTASTPVLAPSTLTDYDPEARVVPTASEPLTLSAGDTPRSVVALDSLGATLSPTATTEAQGERAVAPEAAIAAEDSNQREDLAAVPSAAAPVPPLQLSQETETLPPQSPSPGSSQGEELVLVAEVAVAGPDGQPLDPALEDRIYRAISTRPGRTTTRTQLQRDINNIFATGVFANVRAVPEDTPLGVRVTFVAQPNPVLTRVQVAGSEVLPPEVVTEIFGSQYGEIIDLITFQESIGQLNQWYQDEGYVLAQVVAAPQVSPDGVVTLVVADGVIEAIRVRYINQEGLSEDDEGNPIRGRTREFIITREFQTQPGDVFRQDAIQADLQRVFNLGIFDDVGLTVNPGENNPREAIVTVSVVERNTGSIGAGVGFNFTGDVFGTLSYRQDNFGGNNQSLSLETQLSTRDILFDISFTDPWIAGDPNRTSYTLNAFARRAISLNFDNGPTQVNLANGDLVRLTRYGGGITFNRPLGGGWEGSLGTSLQRIQVTDASGRVNSVDAQGNPLSASGTGIDDLWTVQLALVQDRRNDVLTPTSGSLLRVGTEQSIPLGSGNILLNRLRGSYSYYVPVSFLSFGEGAQSLAFNIQGGTILGTLPPYEAFSLGGTNSVRGYDEGALGTGRSYLQATAEYRFPLFSFLGGALFVDVGTDLGTGSAVPGNPAGVRGKPGTGFGYGAGLRIQTPLGPIRLDYGVNDQGRGRLHFGIGERF